MQALDIALLKSDKYQQLLYENRSTLFNIASSNSDKYQQLLYENLIMLTLCRSFFM